MRFKLVPLIGIILCSFTLKLFGAEFSSCPRALDTKEQVVGAPFSFEKRDYVDDSLLRVIHFTAPGIETFEQIHREVFALSGENGKIINVKLQIELEIGGPRHNIDTLWHPFTEVDLGNSLIGKFHFANYQGKTTFPDQTFYLVSPSAQHSTSRPLATLLNEDSTAESLGKLILLDSDHRIQRMFNTQKLPDFVHFQARSNTHPPMIPAVLENGVRGYVEVDNIFLESVIKSGLIPTTLTTENVSEGVVKVIQYFNLFRELEHKISGS